MYHCINVSIIGVFTCQITVVMARHPDLRIQINLKLIFSFFFFLLEKNVIPHK